MNSESSSRLLSVWDQAQGEKPGRQAIILLMKLADLTTEQAGALRVGERDARLLRLRKKLLGPEARAIATCPACDGVVEFTFTVDSLIVPSPETFEQEFVFGEYKLRFRLPTAQDAGLLCSAKGIEEAEEILLRRCLRYVRCGEETIAPAEYGLLPGSVLDFISNAMERSDPQAATDFQINCPSCGKEWFEAFDVVSFLWAEIADAAARVFREVHDLAIHYGWPEAEILNMHPARRRMYLTMAEA